jgi:sugar phosphate isomerase/epimerase
MKRYSLVPLLGLTFLALGCGSGDQADTDNAPAGEAADSAMDTTQAFGFQGDFKGPLGLQLYSVRTEMAADVPGTLRRVRELGFREVELAGTYGLTPEAFRQELDRAGLDATAMHAPYERMRDSLQTVLQEAKTLGSEAVGVAWIPHPEGPLTVALARRTAADFNRWARAASEQGLRFFYHIHGYEFQPDASGVLPMDVLMQETDPGVKYELDVFWATRPGADPAALLRKYPDRWEFMHIKDMKQGTATDDHSGSAPPDETEVPVGTGLIDYPGVLRAAQEIGLDRYYIEDETTDPFDNIAQSIQFLRTVRY